MSGATRPEPPVGRAEGTLRRVAGIVACALVACTGGGSEEASEEGVGEAAGSGASSDSIPVVSPVWETPRDTLDNIDSPAVWRGPDGQSWLLATAKETDVIVVSDASTGEVLQRIGGEGTEPGRMDRPNGVAVEDDLLFLVERDNARVQVFRLPDFASLGTYGEEELVYPYGISVIAGSTRRYTTYITDNYELSEDVIPPDSLLGQRVRVYDVSADPSSGLDVALVNTFGDTSGDGVLRVVESIAADPAHDRVLIAEEQEGASMLKGYSLDGSFRGEIVPSRFFPHQAEGIVVYECGEQGYWIATDQGEQVNTFHVFDRATLAHVGSFRGDGVLNTDGIALTQRAFPGFESGGFFAVHDDGNVAAFRWADVASALDLRADCLVGPE